MVWDTTLQRKIAPEKLARVASYGWMGAMVFLPAGYALAGPIATAIGVKAYLVIAAGWIVVSTCSSSASAPPRSGSTTSPRPYLLAPE